MKVADSISQKIQEAFQPTLLQVDNESHMHSGPRTDSHFKLVVVAEHFQGMSKVKRHQQLYKLLHTELQGPVHALALHLYSPSEWQEAAVPASPLCSSKK